MNITRVLSSKLDVWFSSKYRKPLLLRGARQVGKSHLLREWGKRNSAPGQFLEINFEETPAFKSIFVKDSLIPRILTELQISTGVDLNQSGSVLFLDEIQDCPEAIVALRYFAEKFPALAIVAAGSLVDFVLSKIGFPVGRIDSLALCPLSFSEFLVGLEKGALAEALDKISLDQPLPEVVFNEAQHYLRLYFRVGGMPEAVAVYKDSLNLAEVGKVHSRLINSYKDDFAKYADENDWEALNLVFSRIPAMIGNNRVNYVSFDPGMRSEKIKRALRLLHTAGLCHFVNSTQAVKLPLQASSDERFFKLLFLDIGLMQAVLGFDWQKLNPGTLLNDIFNGAFAEQFVGQEMLSYRSESAFYCPHYWYRAVKGSEAEVDYVVEHQGNPTPVEVKSGSKGTLRSLALYREKFSPPISFVLSDRNVGFQDKIHWLPLFLSKRIW